METPNSELEQLQKDRKDLNKTRSRLKSEGFYESFFENQDDKLDKVPMLNKAISSTEIQIKFIKCAGRLIDVPAAINNQATKQKIAKIANMKQGR